MKKIIALSIVFFLTIFNFNAFSADLNHQRDSLIKVLNMLDNGDKNLAKGQTRLDILNNLFDLDLALGKRDFLYPLWEEAVRQNDINTIDDIALPMALSYQNSGKLDSAKVWKERCIKYLPELRRENALEYLILMKDLKANDRYNEIIERIIKEKVELNPEQEPFKAMRILYTLSTLTTFANSENKGYDLKNNFEYLKEALEIAKQLEFREGFRFHRQILMGMATQDIKYARELLELNQKFYQEKDIVNRPYYSRKGLITSYERMLANGRQLSKKDIDTYYLELKKILKEYPRDTPAPFDYYNAKINYRYALLSDDVLFTLDACDSIIKYATIYKRGPEYHYAEKINMLKYLKRWEEACVCSDKYIHIKDSLAQVVQSKKLSELQVQYDVDSLKRAEQSRRVQLSMAIVILILVSAILVFFILYSISDKRKTKVIINQLRMEAENIKKIASETSEPLQTQVQSPSIESVKTSYNDDVFNKMNTVFIKEKLYLDPTINRDMVTERFGINKNKFAEIFSESNQGSFADYITELRLRESLIVMENNPSISSNEIAEKSGFNVYSSYYRAFIKKYGIKPSEYRKNIN